MPDNATTGIDKQAFKAKYGLWAVISGASDGTGAAYARQLAEAGLNLVLIGRRPEPLEALAEELKSAHGIETRIASIDLYQSGAGERVLLAAAGVEVGLYISNAGADTNGKPFLDAPFEAWRNLINRNVLNMSEAVYGFAAQMKTRGRGGLILMSSGAGLGGQAGVAVYSATKAFDLNLAESLWMELKPHGIDVVAAIAPAMDTPSLRKVLGDRQIPGIHDPDSVSRRMLERLGQGPSYAFAFGPEGSDADRITEARRQRVETVSNMTKMFFGES